MLGLNPEQRPALTPENESVLAVWNFCGGWKPALWPVAFAYLEINDAEYLIDMLLVVRAEIDKRRAK